MVLDYEMISCVGGSDSPDKPFLFYYQFPVVILYCFSFISGFIKFSSLWNMPTAFIFWVINAFILFLKLGHIKMDMSVGDCPLWVQTCFTLGWHLAKLWQIGANCPSASIPHTMWARWTRQVWARSTFIWTAITSFLSFPSHSLPTCSPVSHYPDQHCCKYSGQLPAIPWQTSEGT